MVPPVAVHSMEVTWLEPGMNLFAA